MALNVAIIGAGPGGTCLARLLLQHNDKNISVSVFEAESAPDFRSQGGSLDLHPHTGQAALQKAGLFDEFQKHARYDGEAMRLADKKLLAYVRLSGAKQGSKKSTTGRPEIDRPRLRELLTNSLPAGTIHWGMKLVSISSDRTLTFADGSTRSGFDLVVGADGAWSHTRALLTDVKPYYSGVAGHSFSVPDAATAAPELSKLVNHGSVFAFSDGRSIMAQQMGDGSLNVATWAAHSADWQTSSGYDVHDGAAVKAAVRRDYADWDPRIVALTQHATDHVVPRDLFMLPIGHTWSHVPGVTLIGDAAHLMTPFAGEGVNLALADAMDLAEAITSSSSSALDSSVVAFEQKMFARMTATQQRTYDNMYDMYFTPGAPRAVIERYITRMLADEAGKWTTDLLVRPLVHAWFWVFKLIW